MLIKYIEKDLKANNLLSMGTYTVISMDFILNTVGPCNFDIKYRIVNKNGIAALYDQSFFEVVVAIYDDDFVFRPYVQGSFELVPKEMSYDGYWEDFFNGDQTAVGIFKNRFSEYSDLIF
jgi:hypothetical protein